MKEQRAGRANATMAKIRAIYGKRLRPEDFAQLISCTGVGEAAQYLKDSTHYAKPLEGINGENIHRGQLESLLRRAYYERYFEIVSFEGLGDVPFYSYITRKTEVDQILECITHINSGVFDQIVTLPVYMNRHTRFDLVALAKVRSFDELMQVVGKTGYGDMLKRFRPREGGRIDYPAVELALRTDYYDKLIHSTYVFPDNVQLEEFLRERIDMINIINAYRMKVHFSMDGDEIRSRMIPVPEYDSSTDRLIQHITQRKLDEMYAAPDRESFLRLLSASWYGREMEREGLTQMPTERALETLQHRRTRHAFAMANSTPAVFFTFNSLLETEINNVIRVIEGIRYSLPVEEISTLIID